MAYTLWTRHLKNNPADPHWFDRDRFVLSGGHGSMLLYSRLFLTGHDLPLDEIKRFRQWGSETISVEGFGASAPGEEIMCEYGFSVDNVLERVLCVLNACRPQRRRAQSTATHLKETHGKT